MRIDTVKRKPSTDNRLAVIAFICVHTRASVGLGSPLSPPSLHEDRLPVKIMESSLFQSINHVCPNYVVRCDEKNILLKSSEVICK